MAIWKWHFRMLHWNEGDVRWLPASAEVVLCSSTFGRCSWERQKHDAPWSITSLGKKSWQTRRHQSSLAANQTERSTSSVDSWASFSCGYSDSFFSSICFTRRGLARPRVAFWTSPINLLITFSFPPFIAITFKKNRKTTRSVIPGQGMDIFVF